VYPNPKGGYPRLVSEELGPAYVPVDGQTATVPLGHIPQVRSTHGYWESFYGIANDAGLTTAETTCASKTVGWAIGQPGGHNLFAIRELNRIALERCATARCAVLTMGALAEQHGFYADEAGTSDHPLYGGGGETLGVVDAHGEAWVFHVATGPGGRGAVWAAQRVPDHQVAAVANGFVIRAMDLSDETNYLASQGLPQVAEAAGWWRPGQGPFDFTAAVSFVPTTPILPVYVGRRLWRVFDLLAPSLALDPRLGWTPLTPTYPFAVTPDQPVTLEAVFRIIRDHYEGTPFDLTVGAAAGPFGTPVRWGGNPGAGGGWERALSMYRATYSYVAHVRPHLPPPLTTVVWFGQDAPHGTVYVPVYSSQRSVPASYTTGRQSVFSLDSAWWAFNLLNNWMQLRYSRMVGDLRAHQGAWEAAGRRNVEAWDREAATLLPDADRARGYLEQRAVRFAADVVAAHWALALRTVAKYSNGLVIQSDGSATMPGYPEPWLNLTSYRTWPGDTVAPPAAPPPAAAPGQGAARDLCVLLTLALGVGIFILTSTRHEDSGYHDLP